MYLAIDLGTSWAHRSGSSFSLTCKSESRIPIPPPPAPAAFTLLLTRLFIRLLLPIPTLPACGHSPPGPSVVHQSSVTRTSIPKVAKDPHYSDPFCIFFSAPPFLLLYFFLPFPSPPSCSLRFDVHTRPLAIVCVVSFCHSTSRLSRAERLQNLAGQKRA